MQIRATRVRRAPSVSLPRRTPLIMMLLLAAVSVLGLAASAQAQSFDREDAAAIERYTLTMAKFDAWVQASTEIADAAKTMKKTDDDSDDDTPTPRTLDEMADQLVAIPEVRRAVRNARLTPREFTILNLVILQAVMADALIREVPNAEVPKGINRANLEFVRANRAKIDARLKELQAKRQDG